MSLRIDAKGLHYRELNERIREAVNSGVKNLILDNVNGQRYIGGGLKGDIKITINGVPGNDLASFMDGPAIIVNSNGEDGVGNTMNAGKVVIYGDSGDILGHSIRGGKIYVKGSVGYRVGIHMKSYQNLYPVIIIGGKARDFLGEYMAGGLIIVLGLEEKEPLTGNYTGTGMHGGKIYVRGKIEEYQLGKEVEISTLTKEDKIMLQEYIKEYCDEFSLSLKEVFNKDFIALSPHTSRPYGKLYAY